MPKYLYRKIPFHAYQVDVDTDVTSSLGDDVAHRGDWILQYRATGFMLVLNDEEFQAHVTPNPKSVDDKGSESVRAAITEEFKRGVAELRTFMDPVRAAITTSQVPTNEKHTVADIPRSAVAG